MFTYFYDFFSIIGLFSSLQILCKIQVTNFIVALKIFIISSFQDIIEETGYRAAMDINMFQMNVVVIFVSNRMT